jgi:predicted MFS family arabinose efflux permease
MSAVAPTFPVLLASRFLYAAGYATQNPISMGIIPELFPRKRASAMAAYNTAIHLGRAVSFGAGALAVPPPVVVRGAAMAASSLAAAVMSPSGSSMAGMPEFPPAGAVTLPIERLEDVAQMGGMGILYITGDLLVLTPMSSNEGGISIGETARAGAAAAMAAVGLSWRDVMLGIALPGLVLAPLLIATVRDPGRTQDGASRAIRRRMRMAGGATEGEGVAVGITTLVDSLREVFSSSPWRLITAAAVMTDFGAWALISFQSTFYERVFGLSAATYSPVLACILPIAGIAGGVGGSLLVDRLSANGHMQQRRLLLVGASLLAAPVMTASLLAPDWITSVIALLPATALAEVWRAPATVIVRDAAPKGAPGAATAAYLAVRNALCGLGPVTAAWLTHVTDLRHALLITPAALVAAAGLFYAAEVALDNERTQREAATE